MDDLLTPLKTIRLNHGQEHAKPLLEKAHDSNAAGSRDIRSPDDVLNILRDEPSSDELNDVLVYLNRGLDGHHDFNVKSPNAQAAKVLNVLVTITVPHFWGTFGGEEASNGAYLPGSALTTRHLLTRCLSSVAGIGALLTHLKSLTGSAARQDKTWTAATASRTTTAKELLDALVSVVEARGFLSTALKEINTISKNRSQQHVLWRELVSLLAGSKILSTAAEVIVVTQCVDAENDDLAWIGDSKKYAHWLGKCICETAMNLSPTAAEEWPMLGLLLKRSLTLPHAEMVVAEIYTGLLLDSKSMWAPLRTLLEALPPYEQRLFFDMILKDLTRTYLASKIGTGNAMAILSSNKKLVGAAASLVSGLTKGNLVLGNHLVEWLSTGSAEKAAQGFEIKRAAIAALAVNDEQVQVVLQKNLQLFADKLRMKHTSTIEQEDTAQILLLAAGSIHRSNVQYLVELSKSSLYLNAISNRLAASSSRARLLGMVVGMAISSLIDTADKAMKFDIKDLEGEDGKWYLDIVKVEDSVGSLQDLKIAAAPAIMKQAKTSIQKRKAQAVQSQPKPQRIHTSKIIAIEEIHGDSESDDELVAYQKPDEDPSDSDEDPTLINRAKPVTPVYIRDLVKYLKSDDHDKVELALRTAPSLIRRKAHFGTEVMDNMEVLAQSFVNLTNDMDKKEYHDLRTSALIGLLVQAPLKMGPWLVNLYFDGDLSLAGRASLLTVIGLGCREMAGYDESDVPLPKKPDELFPTKHLPAELATLYAPETSPINALSNQLSQNTLRPMALAAADTSLGPNVLKVRTFSSRMDVEAKKKKKRKTNIPKDLHNSLSNGLFYPLCCRMNALMTSTTATRSLSVLLDPHILRLHLQTLQILLITIGPHAHALPGLTRETVLLLTSLHNAPKLFTEPAVLPAILSLLLSILDLNVSAGPVAEQRLITDLGAELVEVREWVGSLGEIMGDGEWRVIGAAIMVLWGEIERKYQGLVMALAVEVCRMISCRDSHII